MTIISSQILIHYRFKNSRQGQPPGITWFRRCAGNYENIYNNETYKKGLYRSFLQQPGDGIRFPCKGNKYSLFNTMERRCHKGLLGAYQTDLKGQKLGTGWERRSGGSTSDLQEKNCAYVQERWGKTTVIFLNIREIWSNASWPRNIERFFYNEMPSGWRWRRYMKYALDPSFADGRFIPLLQILYRFRRKWSWARTYFAAEHVNRFRGYPQLWTKGRACSGLRKEKKLKRIQTEIPYQKMEHLFLQNRSRSQAALEHCVTGELADMNGMREPEQPARYESLCYSDLRWKQSSAEFWPDDVTLKWSSF